MPESSLPVRHRAAGRPTTALTDLAHTATGSVARAGRRTAVVLAGSGLLASVFAAPAGATPSAVPIASVDSVASLDSVATVDTSGLTAAARAALLTAPVVSVPTDVAWTLDVPALTVVADPEPEPEPVRATKTASTPVGADAPSSANGSAVMEIASRYLGVPYLWGGGTPSGFDCSGFTSYVWAQLGVTLPHSSASQRGSGTVVSRDDAQPGDLIVTPGHVALYAGDGMLIDATPGSVIRFHKVYQSNPVFIRVG